MEKQTWLTVKEAANYLKCSKPSLYRYLKTYDIKTVKLIGKTLISQQSIDAVIMQQA